MLQNLLMQLLLSVLAGVITNVLSHRLVNASEEQRWIHWAVGGAVGMGLFLLLFLYPAGSGQPADQLTASIPAGRAPAAGQDRAPTGQQAAGAVQTPSPGVLLGVGDPFYEAWDVGEANVRTRNDMKYPSSSFSPAGFKTTLGEQMPNALVVAPPCSQTATHCFPEVTLIQDHVIGGKYQRLTGTLFVPDVYRGQAGDLQIGRVTVLGDNGAKLYESPVLNASATDPKIPFTVNVSGVNKLRLLITVSRQSGKILTVPPSFTKETDKMWVAAIGVSNLWLEP